MSITNKLNYLIETKKKIKEAIEQKGVSILDTDSFRSYAEKIKSIETGSSGSIIDEKWCPEADWWDIENIIQNDTEEYTQKAIFLLTNELDGKATKNIIKGFQKYKLSDGQVIEKIQTISVDLSNVFDTLKDKECAKGYKTRYVIAYSNVTTKTSLNIPDNCIYAIFDGVILSKTSSENSPFYQKFRLQGVKFINGTKNNSIYFNSYFNSCYSLRSVEGLDTSEGINFSSMFGSCYSLTDIPNINVGNGQNFSSMFIYCYTLKKISYLDTSKGTDFGSMFYQCRNLQEIDNLDLSNNTSNSSVIVYCDQLTDIKNITGINRTNTISNSNYLNHATLLKIINALKDCTDEETQKLTLGSTNLAKLTNEEKAMATSKNWTLA